MLSGRHGKTDERGGIEARTRCKNIRSTHLRFSLSAKTNELRPDRNRALVRRKKLIQRLFDPYTGADLGGSRGARRLRPAMGHGLS